MIKHMVDRFLSWRLPADFSPDAGISFKPAFNEHTAHPMRHEPTGTNLLDATQATAMVRYMLDGLPLSRSGDSALVEAVALLTKVKPWMRPLAYRDREEAAAQMIIAEIDKFIQQHGERK